MVNSIHQSPLFSNSSSFSIEDLVEKSSQSPRNSPFTHIVTPGAYEIPVTHILTPRLSADIFLDQEQPVELTTERDVYPLTSRQDFIVHFHHLENRQNRTTAVIQTIQPQVLRDRVQQLASRLMIPKELLEEEIIDDSSNIDLIQGRYFHLVLSISQEAFTRIRELVLQQKSLDSLNALAYIQSRMPSSKTVEPLVSPSLIQDTRWCQTLKYMGEIIQLNRPSAVYYSSKKNEADSFIVKGDTGEIFVRPLQTPIKGGFKKVLRAQELTQSRPYILAVIKSNKAYEVALKEFCNMERVHTLFPPIPNLAPRYTMCLPIRTKRGTYKYILVQPELIEGDGSKLIGKSLKDIVPFLRDIAAALKGMHAHGLIHADVKPENTLIQNGKGLLNDFGQMTTRENYSGGTSRYQPPEVLQIQNNPIYASHSNTYRSVINRLTTEKIDSFSLGVMILELAFNVSSVSKCFVTFNTDGFVNSTSVTEAYFGTLSQQEMAGYFQNFYSSLNAQKNRYQDYSQLLSLVNLAEKLLKIDRHQRLSCADAYEQLENLCSYFAPTLAYSSA